MIYPFQLINFCPSFQDTAVYFNSMVNIYEYPASGAHLSYATNIIHPIYQDSIKKFNNISERPTDDHDSQEEDPSEQLQVKIQEQNQSNNNQLEPIFKEQPQQGIKTTCNTKNNKPIHKKAPKTQKSCVKNLESNLINNVFSYICYSLKSYEVMQRLLKTQERTKIFYIFANNLKKLNSKYLSRKNIMDICQITTGKVHYKMLCKSIKRLQLLPIQQLRTILRQTLFYYLRSQASLIPLLTSKKMSKVSILQHLKKKRQLKEYFLQQIQVRDKTGPNANSI